MSENWKTALHDYVRHRNQIETDYSLEPLYPLITDRRFLYRLHNWVEQVRSRQEVRSVTPLKSETKLRIVTWQQQGADVSAEIELHRINMYRHLHKECREERCEREYVTCSPSGSRWLISKIVPVSEERKNVHTHDLPLTRSESLPYINAAVFAAHEPVSRSRRYNRLKVKEYANTHWNEPNPDYEYFAVDCTNYVSQCLFAGGMPMHYTGKRDAGWWYKGLVQKQEQWSYSWAVSHSLNAWLFSRRTGLFVDTVDTPLELAIGDVIVYDWDGSGRFQHSTVVTGTDAAGMPLVNAHTVNSRGRYWDYRDSYAWTPNTKYGFYHISDSF